MVCTLPFMQAPTMFVWKKVVHKALDILFGDKWDIAKGLPDRDIYRCKVAQLGI